MYSKAENDRRMGPEETASDSLLLHAQIANYVDYVLLIVRGGGEGEGLSSAMRRAVLDTRWSFSYPSSWPTA